MAPVSAVNADHQRTMRVKMRRGPIRSARTPAGISNRQYERVNVPVTHPQPTGSQNQQCQDSMTRFHEVPEQVALFSHVSRVVDYADIRHWCREAEMRWM